MNTMNNKPYTVRTKETGDKVYLIKDGKRHWVTSPEALKEAGFTLGQEETVPYEEIAKLEEGKPISVKQEVSKPVEVKDSIEIFTSNEPILGYKEEATLGDFDKFNG